MLISTIVLVLMSSAYIVFEYNSNRAAAKKNLSTLGVVIASNSSAALAFDSRQDAAEILEAFKADEHIIAACLYDKNGDIFAKYPHNLPSGSLPAEPGSQGYEFKNSFLEGFEPVLQENLFLGTLYIKSDLKAIYAQLRLNSLVAVFFISASLLITYIISNLLQRTISQPVISLKRTAEIISQKHDYSVRAVKMGNDELGLLTDAFNQMLEQIEAQNLEIIKVNEESSKLAAIVESSRDAIIGCSLELLVTSWNNSAEQLLGCTAEEMIGQSIFKIIPQDQQGMVKELFEQLKEGAQVKPFETQFLTLKNRLLDVSLTISPVKNSQGEITGISQIARDISVQKQNERLIIENEEHLRLATQSAELGTFDWNLLKGTIVWDKKSREFFGLHPNEMVTYEHLRNAIHKDDRERVTKTIRAAFDKAQTGGNYDNEYRIYSRDGKMRWIRAKGMAFFNKDGKAVRFIGIILNITDKKQEEQRKNDFITIISHELKTPLTSVKSYIQLLLAGVKKYDSAFAVNALKRAEVQTNKMTAMIRDFLSLAHIEAGRIQLNEEVFEITGLMKDIIAEEPLLVSGHTIKFEERGEVNVYADKDKIGQVLNNFLSNAVKYSPKGSVITLGCEVLGEKVKVYVRDEGIGINPEDQQKLFRRFFRIRNEKAKMVSGFGLGLYIAAEILRCHNSTIEVESTEGRGSAFYFVLDIVP